MPQAQAVGIPASAMTTSGAMRTTSRARARSPTVITGGKAQGPSQKTAYGFQGPAGTRNSVSGNGSIALATGSRSFNNTRNSTGGSAMGNVRESEPKEPKTSRTSRLSVVVRKRPMNKREVQSAQQDVVMCRESAVVVKEPKLKVDLTRYVEEHNFLFDQAFDENATNESLYKSCVQPVIDAVFQKAKCTCFAYGQTGSGKTFTMMGPPKRMVENLLPEERIPGIFLLASQDLFRGVASQEYSHLGVFIAFYEIYCGKLFDLLNNRQLLHARENAKGNVVIGGLQELQIGNCDNLMEVIEAGLNSRTTGVTGANVDSSRSHAILQISLKDLSSQEEHGKISFIDLAGSERGADTLDTDRQTRMDGAEINKSLLALKECIRALDQQLDHTPFRGSKLTQVLKDSFVGANCRTVMIANVSPCSGAVEHSLNTLRYAYRVKELRSAPSKTVVPVAGGTVSSLDREPLAVCATQGDLAVNSSDSELEDTAGPLQSKSSRSFREDLGPAPVRTGDAPGGNTTWNSLQRLSTSVQVANAVAAANAQAVPCATGGSGGISGLSGLTPHQQMQHKELQQQKEMHGHNHAAALAVPTPQAAHSTHHHQISPLNGTKSHHAPSPHAPSSNNSNTPTQSHPQTSTAVVAPPGPATMPLFGVTQDPVAVAAAVPDSQAALDELARQHDRLIGTILAEEEELISSHRSHIDMMVELIKEEMVHLNNVDRPGSDVDAYVNGLDRILRLKADYIDDIRSKVDLFKEHLAQEDGLSRKFSSLAQSSG